MSGTKTMCTICNLMLNSYDQYVAHIGGRAHKRKESLGPTEQQLTAPIATIVRPNSFINFVAGQNGNSSSSSQNTQNYSGTSGESQMDETAQNDKNVSLTQQSEVFCHTSVVRLTSQSEVDMQFSGFEHKRAVALTVPGASGETRGEGVKRKMEEICEVCKVPLISKVVADAHYAGAKHAKKLKLLQNVSESGETRGEGVKRKMEEICEVCNVPLISKVVADAHYAGAKHGKKIKLLQNVNPDSLSSTNAVVSHIAKAQAGNLFFCSYCKLPVNSQLQLEAHQQGTKHMNAVNGSIQQKKKTFKPRQPQIKSRFVKPPENMAYVKPQEQNMFPEQSRFVGHHHFQTGNFGNPSGPMQFRPVAYPTSY